MHLQFQFTYPLTSIVIARKHRGAEEFAFFIAAELNQQTVRRRERDRVWRCHQRWRYSMQDGLCNSQVSIDGACAQLLS